MLQNTVIVIKMAELFSGKDTNKLSLKTFPKRNLSSLKTAPYLNWTRLG